LGDTIKHISAWARVKIVQSSQHPGIFAQTPCDTWAVIVGFFTPMFPIATGEMLAGRGRKFAIAARCPTGTTGRF
jgi:hypothetical protein